MEPLLLPGSRYSRQNKAGLAPERPLSQAVSLPEKDALCTLTSMGPVTPGPINCGLGYLGGDENQATVDQCGSVPQSEHSLVAGMPAWLTLSKTGSSNRNHVGDGTGEGMRKCLVL